MAYKPKVLAQTEGGSGQSNFSGNRVLIDTKVANNSAASVVFTSGVTGYLTYAIQFYNVVSGDGATIKLRYSTNGGSSYDSGANYTQSGYYNILAGVTSQFAAGADSVIIAPFQNNDANVPACGEIVLFNMTSAAYKSGICNWVGKLSSGLGNASGQAATTWANTGVPNAFQIITDTGNLVTGTFKLFGIVN